MTPNNIQTITNDLRKDVQNVADKVLLAKKDISTHPTQVNEDRGEVIANLTLAYRHLEDAKMRLGKVIQAVEGVSIYDTPAK